MSLLPLDRRAQETPEEPALADDLGVLSWSGLADQVARAAARLLEFAPGPGDRIAVLGDNAIPTLVAHLAGLRAGVGTVATSRNLTSGELVDQIIDAGVTGIVAGPAGAGAALDAARELGLPIVTHGTPAAGHAFDWDQWLAAAPAGRTLPTDRPARPPLVYTSGTTGRARGTEVRWVSGPVADSSAYLAAMSARPGFPPGPHLVCGPLQHNAPLTSLRHLAAGQPVVVLGRYDAESFLSRVQKWRVSSTVMVPTHFQRLLALPEEVRARYDVSSLRQVSHTGSACPPDVKRAMIDWFGPVLTESYGASEAGTVARISSTEWLAHPGSVGRVRPPFEVARHGRRRPATAVRGTRAAGLPGARRPRRPLPRGPGQDQGRLSLPRRLHARRHRLRRRRRLHLHHRPGRGRRGLRRRRTCTRPRARRSCAEHPAVVEVAVIGVPDPDFGESLRALVVVAGDEPPAGELDGFCRERLAAYKCPKSYEFVPELLRNAMGKLDKRAMRRPYWGSERTIAG